MRPKEGGGSSIDQRILSMLERSFAAIAGPDARIDAAELKKALGLRSEYLAGRVLRVFDRDGSGAIERDEFLAGVRALIFGDVRDKLLFAFRVHDDDGDGAIVRPELFRMVMLGLAEDDVTVSEAQAQRLVDALFSVADRNRDGRITFDELEAVVRAHPSVLDAMTRSEARWIAPNEDLLERIDQPRAAKSGRVMRTLENHGVEILIVLLWVLANAALFTSAVIRYWDRGANEWVQIARGAGACLNFNGALILIPMMRRALTWARKTWLGRVIPIDESVTFHRMVGHAMFAFGLVHTAAHLTNYTIGTKKPFVDQLFMTQAGLTGLTLLVVFSVMWIFARAAVRRSGKFELFYFTHLLYIVWLGLMLAHGPVFWMWAGVPIAGFAIEQLLRLRRRAQSAEIIAGHALRSGVTRLELKRPPGFSHRAGDYLFLRVPEVAKREWHPFTISSAPERDTITVHVRSLGNWTAALRRLVEHKHASGSHAPLTAQIDGPYGTPSAHIFETRYAVLIGAGIGVTPFAAVLESLLLRAYGKGAGQGDGALRKVHFFWLNKDQYSFEWFAALLSRLEAIDTRDLLDIYICMTNGRCDVTSTALHLARDVLHATGHRDIVTGLRAKTHMGDPDWETLLRDIVKQHAPETVDAYFCGPHGLAVKLRPVCERLGMRFREERF